MKKALFALTFGIAATSANAQVFQPIDFQFAECDDGDFLLRQYEDGMSIIPEGNNEIAHAVEKAWNAGAAILDVEAYRFNGLNEEYREYLRINLDTNTISFHEWGFPKAYYEGTGCTFHNLHLFAGFRQD